MDHGPDFVRPKDVEIFDKIDGVLSEYEAYKLLDHALSTGVLKTAVEATKELREAHDRTISTQT